MIPWEQGQLNAVTHYKICPRCHAKAALTAPFCLVCGRAYHTKFVPTGPQENGGGESRLLAQRGAEENSTPTLSHTQFGLEKGARAEVWMIVLISAVAIVILAAFGSVNQNAFPAGEQRKQEIRRRDRAAAVFPSPRQPCRSPIAPLPFPPSLLV